jgi:hypothetical protein
MDVKETQMLSPYNCIMMGDMGVGERELRGVVMRTEMRLLCIGGTKKHNMGV